LSRSCRRLSSRLSSNCRWLSSRREIFLLVCRLALRPTRQIRSSFLREPAASEAADWVHLSVCFDAHPISVVETATSVQSRAVRTYGIRPPSSGVPRDAFDRIATIINANARSSRTRGAFHLAHLNLPVRSILNFSFEVVPLPMFHLNSKLESVFRQVPPHFALHRPDSIVSFILALMEPPLLGQSLISRFSSCLALISERIVVTTYFSSEAFFG